MKALTISLHLLYLFIFCCRSRVTAVSDEEYCQWETFRPRCLSGETVIIAKAIYGRMSDAGRCLQNEEWEEEVLPALQKSEKYLGCFEDVLHLVSAKCSGQSDCEIRIPDPEMETTNPCYRHMDKYLEVSYYCITVVQSGRLCEVAVNADNKFLLSSTFNGSSVSGSTCGSRDRPWLLEAPPGQRVNISLLDFTSSSSNSSHHPRTVDTESSSRPDCERQFGFIEDKSANRNINICSDSEHRLRTLHVSKKNKVAVVLNLYKQHGTQLPAANFLISLKAVGCSDLVPPSDAWLKRSDNVATVGCFMTRQTWILTCDHTGTWTGTFGNCTQQLEASRLSSSGDSYASQSSKSTNNTEVLVLVIVTGVSILICLTIVCVGATWLCRTARGKKSNRRGYDGELLTTVDVKAAAAAVNYDTASFVRRIQ